MKHNYLVVFLLIIAGTGKIFAQAPKITSFSPSGGPVGTQVIIDGSGFSAVPDSNVVYFGATHAVVNSADAAQLLVTVPVGATYKPITVLNKTTKLSCQSALSFGTTFAPADTTFDPLITLTNVPVANVQMADIDGDGKPDIIATSPHLRELLIFLNQSKPGALTTQSFAAPVIFKTGTQPGIVSIGDMDADGKPDILLLNVGFTHTPNGNNSLTFFHNASTPGTVKLTPALITDSTATAPANYNFQLKAGDKVARVGDIDGDGKPDISVLNAAGFITVYLNKFAPGDSLKTIFGTPDTVSVGNGPTTVVVGDLTNNGTLDLVTTNYKDASVTVLNNTSTPGSVSFQRTDFPLGYSPATVSLADIDGDGKLDLVIGKPANGSTDLVHNTSTPGHFGATSISLTNVNAVSNYNDDIVIQDISGDSKPDILSLNAALNAVYLYTNKSTQGQTTAAYFNNYTTFPIIIIPDCIGDLDGDGRPDIVIGSAFGITIYHATYVPPQQVTIPAAQGGMSIYPNPASMATNVKYYLPYPSNVTISVYDIVGRLLTSYNMGQESAGTHIDDINVSSLQLGVYVVRVQASSFNKSAKLIVQ